MYSTWTGRNALCFSTWASKKLARNNEKGNKKDADKHTASTDSSEKETLRSAVHKQTRAITRGESMDCCVESSLASVVRKAYKPVCRTTLRHTHKVTVYCTSWRGSVYKAFRAFSLLRVIIRWWKTPLCLKALIKISRKAPSRCLTWAPTAKLCEAHRVSPDQRGASGRWHQRMSTLVSLSCVLSCGVMCTLLIFFD